MRISDWSSDVCSSDLALDRRPKIMVTVGILGERVGVYLDGLGEIERDAVAVRRQDAFSEREDRAVHDERAGRRCAGQQTPEPLGPLAEEVTDAIRRCREIIVERRVERVDQIGRNRIADAAIAIALATDRYA